MLFCLLVLPLFRNAAVANADVTPVIASKAIELSNVPADVTSKIQRSLSDELKQFEMSTAGIVTAATVDGLRFRADANNVRFKNGDSWFALNLEGFGRKGSMQKSGTPSLRTVGAQLNFEQKGLTEWYINHGSSFEHGLLLEQRPVGDGPLQFSFAVSGNLRPEQNGNDIVFAGDNSLNYSGIKAWDASENQLVCSMSVAGGRLVWSVDDRSAVYPITVDPTVSIENKLTALTDAGADDTEANAYFGNEISVYGDVALIGAQSKDESGKGAAGAAYIFYRDQGGANNWGIVKKLTARTEADVDDTEANSRFGYSVSISGDCAVVGAYWKNEPGKDDAGSVYIFSRNQGGADNWGIVKKLTARTDADGDDTELNAYFGCSVSISGDIVFVGAYSKNEPGANNAGAVYVFSKDQGGTNNWGIVKKLTARTDADVGDTEADAYFGRVVSASGDLLLVAATFKDESGDTNAGAAYVFSKNAGGDDNWGIAKKLTARTEADLGDTEAYAYFGWSVSISGDIALIGAHHKEASGKGSAGAAYVFYMDQGGASNWGIVRKLTARNDSDGDDTEVSGYFGSSVSISGDLVVVGADGKDESGKNEAGAAYVFSKDQGGANNWGIVKKLTARTDTDGDDTETEAKFGNCVAVSGELALVGADEKNEIGKNGAGAVYVFSIPIARDKIIAPASVQPSGTTVAINSNAKLVRTKEEIEDEYRSVQLDAMLGSQIYEFNATVTYGKVAYFCFNSSSLGERAVGYLTLAKLFSDKPSKTFIYSPDKTPSEEGYFWLTDEANSGQYLPQSAVLTGGQVYTVNYSVKDNGEYDSNPVVGRVTDPVVPGRVAACGCVFNPNVDSSVELAALLLVALMGIFLRFRRK
ncbi:FG-GAP repeat protein [Desulfovibrio sp. JC022]|uniref:FG-GAP repeat protein n=1 Tax=Desulfovibrio sp. JC022 TaxID=2593642 RepID=UPI0013D67234|nr:FG-GAP repeat protein [Desulfovibrio sp. JC022]